MALTQYNTFDPQLDAVNGRQAQEPRVFAHDAWPVVVGAINDTHSTHGIRVTNAGASYTVGDEIQITTNGAATSSAIIVVDEISGAPGSGAVTDYHIKAGDLGAGYQLAGAASIQQDSGAGVFACVIVNIDIPNTFNRGACVFVGAAAGLTTLTVIMEGATRDTSTVTGYTAASPVSFNTISGGTILPILIKQVTSTIATNDVIALY